MITLKEISEDNFEQIINFRRPEGETFVAPNAVSLAQCYLYRDNNDVFPYAIYEDDTPVGFLLLEDDIEDRELWIWRIMFPVENENKGYGTQTIRLVINMAKENMSKYDNLYLDCDETNTKAMYLYKKLGFNETEIKEHGSIRLVYKLSNR